MRPRTLIIRCKKCHRDTFATKYLAIRKGTQCWVNVCEECGETYEAMAPGKKFRTARQRRVVEQVFGG